MKLQSNYSVVAKETPILLPDQPLQYTEGAAPGFSRVQIKSINWSGGAPGVGPVPVSTFAVRGVVWVSE